MLMLILMAEKWASPSANQKAVFFSFLTAPADGCADRGADDGAEGEKKPSLTMGTSTLCLMKKQEPFVIRKLLIVIRYLRLSLGERRGDFAAGFLQKQPLKSPWLTGKNCTMLYPF